MKFELKTDLGFHVANIKNKAVPKKGDFITFKGDDYVVINICHNYDLNSLEVFISEHIPNKNNYDDLLKKEIIEMNEKLISRKHI